MKTKLKTESKGALANMHSVLRQYANGVLTEAETILALQCNEFQISALKQIANLPIAAQAKVCLADWDSTVEIQEAKAYHASKISALDTPVTEYVGLGVSVFPQTSDDKRKVALEIINAGNAENRKP